jgi:hypothetical protein
MVPPVSSVASCSKASGDRPPRSDHVSFSLPSVLGFPASDLFSRLGNFRLQNSQHKRINNAARFRSGSHDSQSNRIRFVRRRLCMVQTARTWRRHWRRVARDLFAPFAASQARSSRFATPTPSRSSSAPRPPRPRRPGRPTAALTHSLIYLGDLAALREFKLHTKVSP